MGSFPGIAESTSKEGAKESVVGGKIRMVVRVYIIGHCLPYKDFVVIYR